MNARAIAHAASIPASLAAAETDAALSFAEQEKSAGTRRAYRADWRIFTEWCWARDLEPLPAAKAHCLLFPFTHVGRKFPQMAVLCNRSSMSRRLPHRRPHSC